MTKYSGSMDAMEGFMNNLYLCEQKMWIDKETHFFNTLFKYWTYGYCRNNPLSDWYRAAAYVLIFFFGFRDGPDRSYDDADPEAEGR